MNRWWIAITVALGLLMVITALMPMVLGRVLLGVGLPAISLPAFSTSDWRGYAAAQSDQANRARQDLRAAEAWLNLGNLEVDQGNYAAALEAYDRGRAIGDAEASANFDLVRAYYASLALAAETPVTWSREKEEGATVQSFEARGNARAAGQGSEVTNVQTTFGIPELKNAGVRKVRKIFDDAFVVADERWLATLEDTPGKFLAARLKAEQKRRQKARQ